MPLRFVDNHLPNTDDDANASYCATFLTKPSLLDTKKMTDWLTDWKQKKNKKTTTFKLHTYYHAEIKHPCYTWTIVWEEIVEIVRNRTDRSRDRSVDRYISRIFWFHLFSIFNFFLKLILNIPHPSLGSIPPPTPPKMYDVQCNKRLT